MTPLEILDAHHRIKGIRGLETRCACGWRTGAMLLPEELHRAHVAEVIDAWAKEQRYDAWQAGYEDGAVHAVSVRAYIDGLADRAPKRPRNPYRKVTP